MTEKILSTIATSNTKGEETRRANHRNRKNVSVSYLQLPEGKGFKNIRTNTGKYHAYMGLDNADPCC